MRKRSSYTNQTLLSQCSRKLPRRTFRYYLFLIFIENMNNDKTFSFFRKDFFRLVFSSLSRAMKGEMKNRAPLHYKSSLLIELRDIFVKMVLRLPLSSTQKRRKTSLPLSKTSSFRHYYGDCSSESDSPLQWRLKKSFVFLTCFLLLFKHRECFTSSSFTTKITTRLHSFIHLIEFHVFVLIAKAALVWSYWAKKGFHEILSSSKYCASDHKFQSELFLFPRDINDKHNKINTELMTILTSRF